MLKPDWPVVGHRPARRSLFKPSKDACGPPAVSANMLCTLWVIFQALAAAVEAGVFSASAETLAKLAASNNNGAAAGTQIGNAEPLLVRLVQLGGSFLLQPVGTRVGQFPLIPAQPGGTVLVGGPGALSVQEQLAQGSTGGVVTLLAAPPSGSAGRDPQAALLQPGQARLLPAATPSDAAARPAAGRLSFQRSVGAPVRRTRSPELLTTEEEEEEEMEECSAMDTDDDTTD